MELPSIGCCLRLSEVYRNVTLSAAADWVREPEAPDYAEPEGAAAPMV
jgi:hypothetical protein